MARGHGGSSVQLAPFVCVGRERPEHESGTKPTRGADDQGKRRDDRAARRGTRPTATAPAKATGDRRAEVERDLETRIRRRQSERPESSGE
jgi:hypothetical protein